MVRSKKMRPEFYAIARGNRCASRGKLRVGRSVGAPRQLSLGHETDIPRLTSSRPDIP